MESSSNACEAADITKRNRSLDLKSIYEQRVSRVREANKNGSDESDHEYVKKKKRKIRKEFPLSFFQSDAQKTRKEVNGVKLVQTSPKKSSSKSQGFQGISLSFLENVNPFIIPKRRRDSIKRKKLEIDKVLAPLVISNSAENLETGVNDNREGSLGVNAVRSGSASTTNGGISSTRRFCEFNSNSKLKKDSAPTENLICSNEKLKKKVKSDEVTESGSDHLVSLAHDVKEENSDPKLKSTSNPKIHETSSNLDLRPNVDSSEPKEKSNGHSSSRKGAAKLYDTKARLKKKVEKISSVKSRDSNSKLRVNVGPHKAKEKNDVQQASVSHECSIAENEGDRSSKMRQGKGRKKNDVVVVRDSSEASKKKSELSTGSSVSNNHSTDYLDDDDDDEENLEKNAARMLSSRFDPSCTGSSRRRYSVFQKPYGSYFPGSSTRESCSSHANSLIDREPASSDEKNRGLRPRREDKANGTRRKRRHFYEILHDDFDPHWVLNQRIKIFWPLDESWYYGLVDEYHSESQLHHIKYDDRDEEWVNLPEEKFKILLLPSDAPGRSKSRKRAARERCSQKQQATTETDGNFSTDYCPDSEPIASWLANQPQLAKASSKTLKGQERQSLVASLSSGEAGESDDGFLDPKLKTNVKSISDFTVKLGNLRSVYSSISDRSSLTGKNVVYVRKRYRESVLKGLSVFENVKASAGSLMSTKKGSGFFWTNSNMSLWCFDDCGVLRLSDVFMRSTDVRFHIDLPLIPVIDFLCEFGVSWLSHYTYMLQNGVIVTTSPAVLLEMIFIDNDLGLKLVLYEGFLGQAIAFVSIIFILFSQSKGHTDENIGLPVTSIRFRLFSVHDLNRQHVFAFYRFSGLESSKWIYLESKISQHCLLIKQLSVLDCTYEKIKELEYGSFPLCKPHAKGVFSLHAYCRPRRKLMPGILPMGISEKACDSRMSYSAFLLAANPGKCPQFALSFTAAPTFFQSLHMQLLMENSFACINLHHQNPVISHVSEPVAECTRFCGSEDCVTKAPVSRGSPDFTKCTKTIIGESQDREPCDSSVYLHATVPEAITSTSSDLRLDSASSDMIGSSSLEKVDIHFNGEVSISGQTSDVYWNLHENFVHGSNSFGFSKSSSLASSFEYHSPTWSDGMPNFTARAFSNGPKKRRTQVQYSLPFVGYDFSSKQKLLNSSAPPYKRIRRANLKRVSDGNGNKQNFFDSLSCATNILVTQGNKGWRENGASVFLELADHNEWRLAIKQSGVPRYYYKVKHILQPGFTNRFSHAMMWKGGKDWMLEFPGRSEWMLFKEMHEECYNRNIRAASLKNIPIPGVWLVEECDGQGIDASFTLNSVRYIRQVQNDVEMAMDPSSILYDMDSDDEQWLVANDNLTVSHKYERISEEFLEKAMDMFEKFSYAQLREDFSNSEVEELVMGLGTFEAGKVVYEHWQKKREKMGMPLIRHLQPPLWERYQQKLKEWERTVARPFSDGSISPEKPPMFAFCLKPRGLELPNKFSKQRSQRKLPISVSGNQDYLHGRMSNGHAFIDEKTLHASNVHHSSDVSPSLLASTRVLSLRDANFLLNSEWKGPPEFSVSKNYYSGGTAKPQNSSDVHEFHVRDASGVATHAHTLAKLKKQKAHRLFCKADLAIHRAVIALMAAGAIRDSVENIDEIH